VSPAEARRTVALKSRLLAGARVQLDAKDAMARKINAQSALDDRKERLQDEFDVEMICTYPGYRSQLEHWMPRLKESRPATKGAP